MRIMQIAAAAGIAAALAMGAGACGNTGNDPGVAHTPCWGSYSGSSQVVVRMAVKTEPSAIRDCEEQVIDLRLVAHAGLAPADGDAGIACTGFNGGTLAAVTKGNAQVCQTLGAVGYKVFMGSPVS